MIEARKGGRIIQGLVLRLALADLLHERLMSLCLILALAAVMTPLLLLFGLKYGTIETLRQRLVHDPAKREIGLRSTSPHSRQWLAKLAQRAEVGFLIPMTRQIANDVRVTTPDSPGVSRLALLPTAPGDPLIEDNGVKAPIKGEAVISSLAADDLGVSIGGTVVVQVEATRSSETTRVQVSLRVTGILPKRASNLRALYSPLPLLEAVESFKDGFAVQEYGWPGGNAVVAPAYDGIVILSSLELEKEMEFRLLANTGLGAIERLAHGELIERIGWSVPKGIWVYLLENKASTIGEDTISAVRERLRGLSAEATPWVRPLRVSIRKNGGDKPFSVLLAAHPLSEGMSVKWKVAPSTSVNEGQSPELGSPLLLVPSGLSALGESATLQLLDGASVGIPFDVRLSPIKLAESAPALAPLTFAGLLRRAQERSVRLAPDGQVVILERTGYPAFRLYATTIDEVDSLRKYLEGEGLTVSTEGQRISEVIELDRHLTRVFSLVALVGIGGGFAALVASLCGSVERKRRELGIMRLMGLPRARLMRFPLSQGLILTFIGFFTSLTMFFIISAIVDNIFQERLAPGESFCRLPLIGASFAAASALGCATTASLVAGIRAMRADPAEVLREE